MKLKGFLSRTVVVALSLVVFLCAGIAVADSAMELDKDVKAALEKLYKDVDGSKDVVMKAKGVLVFPEITKAGIAVGAQHGKGALMIDGKIADYYNTSGASIGLTLGAQQQSVVMAFMTDEALKKFQESSGWEAGVDGSIAVAETGASGSIDTTKTMEKEIVGFVFGAKGLMADLSLDGSKFTKIDKEM